MPTSPQRRLALTAAVAVTLTAGALTATAATTASAAEIPLSGYELTWGIKQSYRTYVTTYAAGTFTPSGGATQAAGNGAFTFSGGTGGYDSDAHTVSLAFQGALKIASQLHGFELTLSDVTFDSKDAEITADVTSNGTTTDDVPLATVTVTRDMVDMATTLTTQAADVFGSSGYAGAAGDPLTVVQTETPSASPGDTTPAPTGSDSPGESASPTDSASATDSASPTDPASPTDSASGGTSPSASPTATGTDPSPSGSQTAAPSHGDIADGTLGWGVKESFRTYVVGPVANGVITVSGGARQAADNGPFTFTDATGSYDTEAGTLSAAFEGAVTFRGHESDGVYALDLTLADLRATLDDGTGTLTADVTSLGRTTKDVVLADLKASSPGLTAQDDVITVDDITATLTEAGAQAFSGYYTAGTALDPVDLSVALTDDATLPSGDGDSDGGTDGTSGASDGGSGTASGGVTGSTTGGLGSLASTGAGVPAGALGAAAAATVVAGAGVVLAARRRRTQG
ncbi:HtaA domain-containing protein [Streptomyces mangrovisoli]|uniref:Htaa domain-containing protein n=1 Tax=Streptomyces mangrovisoli TaxID=1428628 RepID=A0A1J4NYQ3_9ACTN|nr:HtaA domain-containing protein [Streptomyces mangrovisoli]OIJ67186.1 hypothetical protein WN71_014335 [Streptomyces mangrovisoli]